MEENKTIEGTITDLMSVEVTEEMKKLIADKVSATGCEFTVEIKRASVACPVCLGINILREGHCETCQDCGWSKCSL